MEVLSLLLSVQRSIESVRNMLKGDQELHANIDNGLEAIKSELVMLSSEVQKTLAATNQGAKPPEWILQLQELAYNIEDFIEERGRDPKSCAPVRLVQAAIIRDPRPRHLERINHFKERITRIRNFGVQGQGAAQSSSQVDSVAAGPSASPASPNNAPVAQLVGMVQPKQDLAELLSAAGGGHGNELKVISIVGCSGVGKTTLARQLYDDSQVRQQFLHRAWVDAPSLNDGGQLLHCVLQQVAGNQQADNESSSGRDVSRLTTELHNFLSDKRYLVIIDGVRKHDAWAAISPALPRNDKGSRVVVTTSIRSMATGCSSSGSYLYSMRGLDQTDSELLFWAKLGLENPSPAQKDGLKTFFHKCDGLPLLVEGAAEFLRRRGPPELTHEQCKDLGDHLWKHLGGDDPAFGKTRSSLAQCCGSLPDYGHQVCMLSVSAFPKGHRINRKSLIRRWIAEGLVVGDDQQKDACGHLNKLRDLGIVEPAHTNKMKRCQVHGVMLEFLVHQSVSWNFITLIKEREEIVRNNEIACSSRRVSVHGVGEIDRIRMDLCRIRSLTVCNPNCRRKTMSQSLKSCKLLRLLDVEGCSWLSNDHVRVICRLLYLKYLSLRHTQVSKLPRAVKHLHCLETLDLRQTQVAKLPLQVLKLPQLLHLFGKFELPPQLEDARTADKMEKFLSERSRLQTLSGFKIVNNNGGFKLLLLHLKMLRKLKIWCEVPQPPPPPAAASSIGKIFRKKRQNIINVDNLLAGLVASLERFVGSNALDSLSVDFGSHCQDFLTSTLKDGCAVSSLKVCGAMQRLPESRVLQSVRLIMELHLCNTGLPSDDLSRLQSLPCLERLKLVENHTDCWNGSFVVETHGFPSLQQLCFDGPRLPQLQFVGPKPVSPLLSLQLICPEPQDHRLGVTGITGLKHLNEVILHPEASPAKMEAWKQEADNHTNRPYVKKQQNDDGA